MNQRVLYNFELLINEKYYAFTCQPGVTFDDLDAAFVEFKKEFDVMREISAKAEAEAKEKAEAEAAASETPVDAEPVE